MPDEIVALVVRDAQGTAKDIAELVATPDTWGARVHDPVAKARLEEIRNRLPVNGAAAEATLAAVLAQLDDATADTVLSVLKSLTAKDFATQATLAALGTRADLLATEATLAAVLGAVDTLESLTQAVRDRLPVAGTASEASLVSVLAAVDQIEGFVDSLESLTQGVRDRLPLALTAAGNLKTALVEAAGGSLQNGQETGVSSAAIQVIAANASRKVLILQNVGLNNVRIGSSSAVTATTGLRIASGGERIFTMPFCPTNAIYAIREGVADSTVFAAEVT